MGLQMQKGLKESFAKYLQANVTSDILDAPQI